MTNKMETLKNERAEVIKELKSITNALCACTSEKIYGKLIDELAETNDKIAKIQIQLRWLNILTK